MQHLRYPNSYVTACACAHPSAQGVGKGGQLVVLSAVGAACGCRLLYTNCHPPHIPHALGHGFLTVQLPLLPRTGSIGQGGRRCPDRQGWGQDPQRLPPLQTKECVCC